MNQDVDIIMRCRIGREDCIGNVLINEPFSNDRFNTVWIENGHAYLGLIAKSGSQVYYLNICLEN